MTYTPRSDDRDIRVGDIVEGNGTRTARSDGPALPGVVVEVAAQYVYLVKANRRRARVLRKAVHADGKPRANGYTVVGHAEPAS